jgi:hypothetical protein
MRGREVKKLLTNPIIYVAGLTALPLCAMEAISEREMSEVSGQAFITVDASSYSRNAGDEWDGDFEFTKINLGLDIETIFTADSLRVGEFERTVYEDGTVPATTTIDNPDIDGTKTGQAYDLDGDGQFDTLPADIIIENFALGRVVNYRDAATAVIGSKADGGDPFQIRNPFIELAYKIEGGERRVSGVRIGLGQAKGWLSGDILSLTGVLQGQIKGPVNIVFQQAPCNGNPYSAPFPDCFLLGTGRSTEIYSEIGLVDGANNSPTYGYGAGAEAAPTEDGFTYPYANVPYLKRASWAGVPAGRNFKSDFGGVAALIPGLTVSQDCAVEGTPGCFSLSTYQSIYVGNNNDELTFDQTAASGVFVSLQSESVPWEDLSGLDSADRVLTQRGAFLNLAKYKVNNVERFPLLLDLTQAVNGVPRVATCVGFVKGC